MIKVLLSFFVFVALLLTMRPNLMNKMNFWPAASKDMQLKVAKADLNIKNKNEIIDRLNGVAVYFNGNIGEIRGRNKTSDGYNLGLKWQCVEFIKRYYYETYNHKMPNSYGHAKDFFDPGITHGALNRERGLWQFYNNSMVRPKEGDILIFDGNPQNQYGHIAIVAKVKKNTLEIVQQNWGRKSRTNLAIRYEKGKYRVMNSDILGWLSLKNSPK